ncbi:MAG: hypothetical protein ABFR62_08095 [Bacteroidota bacterium]
MNKKLIFIGVFILLLSSVLYWRYLQAIKKDWSENYLVNWDSAYAVSLFNDMLEEDVFENFEYLEQEENLMKDMSAWEKSPENYLFVGKTNYLTVSGIDSLHRYISKGNKAMIVCEEFNNGLYLLSGLDTTKISKDLSPFFSNDSSYVYEPNMFISDNSIYKTLTDTVADLYLKEAVTKSPFHFEARYVEFSRLGNSLEKMDLAYKYDVLGYELDSLENKHPYFIRFNIGEGELYLHTNPLVFTNYFLKTEKGLDYVSHVMSYLDDGQTYCDVRSKSQYFSSLDGTKTSKTQLEFILGNKELRWAWYLILSMGLIYIIFGSKREQRTIPYIAPLRNTSINFAETIGRLFYYQKDHSFLVKRKMKLLINAYRTKYRIKSKEDSKEFRLELHKKTEAKLSYINTLFDRYQFLINKKSTVMEEELNDFFSKIERLEFEIEKMRKLRLERKTEKISN